MAVCFFYGVVLKVEHAYVPNQKEPRLKRVLTLDCTQLMLRDRFVGVGTVIKLHRICTFVRLTTTRNHYTKSDLICYLLQSDANCYVSSHFCSLRLAFWHFRGCCW